MPRRKLLLTGEKGLCMDYHKESGLLVIGTEEGIVNLFDTSDDDLQFHKLLDRQDHRIVCCKFNHTGDSLVTGSIDAVKVWNLKTGHVIHKMSTGRANVNLETIVWCMEVLKDFTIIAGDSRGRVTIWDGNLGSQIDFIQASAADILCLSISADEKDFFCSGVEQLVRKYTKISINKESERWIRCAKKYRLHTHDILAMTKINDNELVTSGVDGFLTRCDMELKVIERFGPFLRNPFAKIADSVRMMLMMYANYLEVEERIEEPESETDENEALKSLRSKVNDKPGFKIVSFPEKLLELRSQKDEMILTAAISDDGKWIAYSTLNAIRIFHFEIENGKPQLTRIREVSSEFKPSLQLASYHSDLAHLMEVSECGKFLAIASLCNQISLWSLKKKKFVYERNLPKHSSPATSMKFNQSSLVIAFSDNKICDYDLKEFTITETLVSGEDSSKSVISHLTLDPNNPNAIIFNQNNSIVVTKHSSGSENDDEIVSNKKKKKGVTQNGTSREIKVAKKPENVSKYLIVHHN
jgi:U3 small nucleolar RNA-associated protein 4